MVDYKPISTELEVDARLCLVEGKYLEDVTMYIQLVGCLIYIMLTKPDIAYAVSVITPFMQKPIKRHLEVVRRILRYVKGTIEYRILYRNDKEIEIIGYCNDDYASDLDTHRSTMSYVFNLGFEAVSWCSKRQPTVFLSSTKAEYGVVAMAT
ncbi:uncharacterized mitochondrial protein AtMg00810-like [Beta vulgaris subsp. vulgaris]|uniref:uncharacterized mitochondrial protein AtMg00810-like n=1 Tax=Beta vulgaris subsp. vulgaris TaxID=3555 RepID=UPI002036B139|nr:uncharacterized mitochondrial protein AtMg00810-like [Beta vulgaris subsp. vulgaris]